MTRIEFCPYCEEEQPIETLERDEEVTVRGEVFCVPAIVHRCTHCGDEFTRSTDALDPVDAAFSLYREKHGMLSPSVIREFRRKYELTQKELSCLLGWGAVTLSRYENGALQDLAHDRQLQTAMKPEGLRELIRLTPSALDDQKRSRLLDIVDSRRGSRAGLLPKLEERAASYSPNMINGFRRFSSGRFAAVLEFFLRNGGILKTKLNKLMFYADFLHFRDFGVSMTGCCYARLPHGPVPNDFRTLLAVLEEEAGTIRTETICYPGADYQGEEIVLSHPMAEHFLTEDEKATLEKVEAAFIDFGAREIAEYSHLFEGWKETDSSRLISYEYAQFLKLPQETG